MVPEIFAAGGIECVDGCRFVPKHIGEQFRWEDLFDAFRVREDFPIVSEIIRMFFDDEGDVLKDVDPQEFVGANLFLFAHHVEVGKVLRQ